MKRITEEMCIIDDLADEAGGYFAMQKKEDIAYTDLLFNVCRQFKIRYYSATPEDREFAEEVTRVTWACQEAKRTGVKRDIRPSFSA